MKNQRAVLIAVTPWFLLMFLTTLLVSMPVQADWQKLNPPPDVDKFEHHGYASTNTCYLAVAANMLAGLSYGDGNDVQERADEIYDELVDHYGIQNAGWADTAMNWWLNSANNTWKLTNPYKIVSLYGEANCKSTRNPWANQAMPKFVGNELRKCNSVRLSLYKSGICYGHAITAWGDSGGGGNLANNPGNVKVADSDYADTDQILQTYTYDDYNDNGQAWYINYNFEDEHRYVDNVVTLSNCSFTDFTQPIGVTKKFAGSYKIHQSNAIDAQDLHYKVSSGKMYSYKTTIDWDTNNTPDITEDDTPPTELTVNWDLSDNPVPFCTWVTINTEVVIPWVPGTGVLNPVTYDEVYFTYPFNGDIKADFGWQITTPDLRDYNDVEPNATSGYVVGAFDLYADPVGTVLIGEYRLLNEYDYSQDPEHHQLILTADPQTYFVGNFRFGHSYAYLDKEALWQFTSWLSDDPPPRSLTGTNMVPIDFAGQFLLPYPTAQDYKNPVPQDCGDPGTYYVEWDVNKDCLVNFGDFAEFAFDWLQCTDPNTNNCP
ncbi:MAG: hypothetical protein ACYS1A_07080 [Planctomycetota bacterium]|jgi:hypothetical protein